MRANARGFTTTFAIGFLGITCASCKSRDGDRPPAKAMSSQIETGIYETVNSVPQFSVQGNQFYFYWGIWRSLSPAEDLAVKSSPAGAASIVSRRSVVWDLKDCETGALLHRDHEEFWYLDELRFDDTGMLRPLREAARPGWRYFSMANFDSTVARGAWGFPSLVQRQDESNREFRERFALARNEWVLGQSRKGQRGQVMIEAGHRFLVADPAHVRPSFVSFFDYRADDTNLLDGVFARYNPAFWPVFYDERAHKPHSLTAPAAWEDPGASVNQRNFNARLTWDWCGKGEKPEARLEVTPGSLPPPGPNRPGRSDAGNTTLPVVDWVP